MQPGLWSVRASWLAVRLSHAQLQQLLLDMARFAPAIDIGPNLGDGTARHTLIFTVEASSREEALEIGMFWVEFAALAELRSFELFAGRPARRPLAQGGH